MATRTTNVPGFNIQGFQDENVVDSQKPNEFNPETPKAAQQALADQAKQAESPNKKRDYKKIAFYGFVTCSVVGVALLIAMLVMVGKRDVLPKETTPEQQVKQIEGDLKKAEADLKVNQQHLKWSEGQLEHLKAAGTSPSTQIVKEYQQNLVRYEAEIQGYQAKINAMKAQLNLIENGPQPLDLATQVKIRELGEKMNQADANVRITQQHLHWSQGQLEHLEVNSQAPGSNVAKGSAEYNRIQDEFTKNLTRRYPAQMDGYQNQIDGYRQEIQALRGINKFEVANQAIRAEYSSLTVKAAGLVGGAVFLLGGAAVSLILSSSKQQ